jgi:hypothetical protein
VHALDIASLGHVMRKQWKGPSSDWQNSGVPRFSEYCELLELGNYDVLSQQAAEPLRSSNRTKLNQRMLELGGHDDYDVLNGRLGVVTAMEARVKFAEGYGQFMVDQRDGNHCRFFTVAAPAAQIFDVEGSHGREQITLIYTNDQGFVLLVSCQELKDDLSMLRKVRWAMAKVGEATIAASTPPAEADAKAGYGGKSGASDHWQGVVFPATSGIFWRQIYWMGGANVPKASGAAPIHSVYQRFILSFDEAPVVEPPRIDSLMDPYINLLNCPFILAKAMPTPSLQAASFPFRVEWVAQTDMADWDVVS